MYFYPRPVEFLKNVIVRGIWELKVGNQALINNSRVQNLKNMVPKQNVGTFSDYTPKMIFSYVSETAIIHFLTPECHTNKMIPHMFRPF